MAAISTRRKPASGELEQLRAELAEVRAELAEMHEALRAVAGLTFGIGVTRAPVGAGGGITTIRGVCGLYGVSGRTETIEKLFAP